MKKYVATFTFLTIASLGFSQTNTIVIKEDLEKKQTTLVKKDNAINNGVTLGKTEVKSKIIVMDEGTNDPLQNGYTKAETADGVKYVKETITNIIVVKTVYIKKD